MEYLHQLRPPLRHSEHRDELVQGTGTSSYICGGKIRKKLKPISSFAFLLGPPCHGRGGGEGFGSETTPLFSSTDSPSIQHYFFLSTHERLFFLVRPPLSTSGRHSISSVRPRSNSSCLSSSSSPFEPPPPPPSSFPFPPTEQAPLQNCS